MEVDTAATAPVETTSRTAAEFCTAPDDDVDDALPELWRTPVVVDDALEGPEFRGMLLDWPVFPVAFELTFVAFNDFCCVTDAVVDADDVDVLLLESFVVALVNVVEGFEAAAFDITTGFADSVLLAPEKIYFYVLLWQLEPMSQTNFLE